MMHGHGKSDAAIVAVKPANKAEPAAEQSAAAPTAAELVEPSAATEGNASQQSMRRTQSRVSVSQVLERIRKVAREKKEEKFTALFHHLSIDLLEEVFFELKENAAPGVDGLRWEDYEANLERNLEDLHDRVQRGASSESIKRSKFEASSHLARHRHGWFCLRLDISDATQIEQNPHHDRSW